MEWSDCGRTTKSQKFYPSKGRRGRKMVGGCGRNETLTSLYAQRLPGRWKKLFNLKFNREPSDFEMRCALRTGEIAENVKSWEKQCLVDETIGKKKRRNNIGIDGVPYSVTLQAWLNERKAQGVEKKRLEDEQKAIHAASAVRLKAHLAAVEENKVPREMLIRISNGEDDVFSAVQIIYGVTPEEISKSLKTFGLAG